MTKTTLNLANIIRELQEEGARVYSHAYVAGYLGGILQVALDRAPKKVEQEIKEILLASIKNLKSETTSSQV